MLSLWANEDLHSAQDLVFAISPQIWELHYRMKLRREDSASYFIYLIKFLQRK